MQPLVLLWHQRSVIKSFLQWPLHKLTIDARSQSWSSLRHSCVVTKYILQQVSGSFPLCGTLTVLVSLEDRFKNFYAVWIWQAETERKPAVHVYMCAMHTCYISPQWHFPNKRIASVGILYEAEIVLVASLFLKYGDKSGIKDTLLKISTGCQGE